MTAEKTRNAEATKAQILCAAEERFAANGFAGSTLRDISKACGVSGPLIVFHFNDKQGLYRAVKEAIVRRFFETRDEGPPLEDSFDAFIEHAVRSMFCFYRDNPTMMRLANWGRLEGDVDPWPGEDEWHHAYRDRIRQAQERGEIRDDLTPFNISTMICGAMHIWWEYHEHFMKHLIAETDQETADELYFGQCLSFVLRGLACEPV